MPFGPVTAAPDGVRLAVRVTPKSSRNAIAGLAEEADGSRILGIQVTAVPEGGKANAAVLKLLAKTWKLPRGAFRIASGDTSRRKVIEIAGAPDELAARLKEWMEKASDG
ncbi:MAG: DUF167 family protein [Rhodospirillaceae bacterium]